MPRDPVLYRLELNIHIKYTEDHFLSKTDFLQSFGWKTYGKHINNSWGKYKMKHGSTYFVGLQNTSG